MKTVIIAVAATDWAGVSEKKRTKTDKSLQPCGARCVIRDAKGLKDEA